MQDDLIIRAADALNADTTLVGAGERSVEAKALLQSYGVDPDEADRLAAKVLTTADSRPKGGDVATGGDVGRSRAGEGCRLERVTCNSPTAANGRCLECGAYRLPPPSVFEAPGYDASGEMTPAGAAVHEMVEADLRRAQPLGALPLGFRPSPPLNNLGFGAAAPSPRSGSFMARVKRSTHRTDTELADLLDLSRSQVQALVAGREGSPLTTYQLDSLADAVKAQQRQLRDLMIEIAELAAG